MEGQNSDKTSSSKDLQERIDFLAQWETLKDYKIKIPRSSNNSVIRTYRSLLKPLKYETVPAYLRDEVVIEKDISIDEDLLNRILLGEEGLEIPAPDLADYFILFDDLQMTFWSLVICYELRKIDQFKILIDLIVSYLNKTGSSIRRSVIREWKDQKENETGNQRDLFAFDNIFCIEIFNILKEHFYTDDFPIELGEKLEEERLLFPLLAYKPVDIRKYPKVAEYLPFLPFSSKSQYDPKSPFSHPAQENIKALFRSVLGDGKRTNITIRKSDGKEVCRAHIEILIRNTNFFYLPLKISSSEEYGSMIYKKEFLLQNVQIAFDTNTVIYWLGYIYTGKLIDKEATKIQKVEDIFITLFKLLVLAMMNCDSDLSRMVVERIRVRSEEVLGEPFGYRKIMKALEKGGFLFSQMEDGRMVNQIFEYWRKPKVRDGEIHSSDEDEILDEELYESSSEFDGEESEDVYESEGEEEGSEEEEGEGSEDDDDDEEEEEASTEETSEEDDSDSFEEEGEEEEASSSRDKEEEGKKKKKVEEEEEEVEGESSSEVDGNDDEDIEENYSSSLELGESSVETRAGEAVIEIEEGRKKKIEEEEEEEQKEDTEKKNEELEQEGETIHCTKKYLTRKEIRKCVECSIDNYKKKLEKVKRPQYDLIDESSSSEELEGEDDSDIDKFADLPELNESFRFEDLDRLEEEQRAEYAEKKRLELLALAALDQRNVIRYFWEEHRILFLSTVFFVIFSSISLMVMSPFLTLIMMNVSMMIMFLLLWTGYSCAFILFEVLIDLFLLAILILFFGSYFFFMFVDAVLVFVLSVLSVLFMTVIPIILFVECELCAISAYELWRGVFLQQILPQIRQARANRRQQQAQRRVQQQRQQQIQQRRRQPQRPQRNAGEVNNPIEEESESSEYETESESSESEEIRV